MMKNKEKLVREPHHDFDSLVSIMDILRSDGGCPWDIEQTHQSIRKCLVEETYEVVEAIDKNDPILLREELGDLLFQVMFHSCIENEKGVFSIYDVIDDVSRKMIYRHPHVFGDTHADTPDAVTRNWDELKKKEKNYKKVSESLRSVPYHLPALLKAQKIISKAESKLGYTPDIAGIMGESIAEKVFLMCREAQREGIDLEMELGLVTDKFISCVEDNEIISD